MALGGLTNKRQYHRIGNKICLKPKQMQSDGYISFFDMYQNARKEVPSDYNLKFGLERRCFTGENYV